MPELPEVETVVRDLAPRIAGRLLRKPRLFKPDVLRDISARGLLDALRDRQVVEVSRRAKHVVFLLDTGRRLVIQPRMTGTLIVYDRPLTAEDRRYRVLQAGLDEGVTFVYRDVRRLGSVRLLDEQQWRTYTGRIGPEPTDGSFDLARFAERLVGTRAAIKKVLMDQRRIAGLGNIYANEVLFRAGVDPSQRSDELGDTQIARLHSEIRAVLAEAIQAQGTTVRDYRTGTGERGSFQFALRAYGRGGEPCVRCGTRLATTHAIDGRSTTFCWRCQGSG